MAAAGDSPAELLLFPCNGNAVEALMCLGPAWRPLAFVDDDPALQRSGRHGHAVHGREAFARWPQARVLAVPGGPASFRQRAHLIEGLGVSVLRWATVIDATARVSPLARIGRNVLIMAGVVITSDAVVEDHVCVLPNSVVHHGAVLGRHSLIGANVTIAGGTFVGRNCYVGSGSTLKDGLTIGDGALIGLGSVVIRDVAPLSTVAGCPARRLG